MIILQKIRLHPQEAINLAKMTGKRNEKLEKIIMKDPYWAYLYILYVIKDRWEEAEPYIMKDPYCAYQYALYVIKDKWEEAEPCIKQDKVWWYEYKNYFKIK